jgi:hypothetical protein
MKACQIETTFYFAAVNDKSVEQTLRALQTQSAVGDFIAGHQGMRPEKLQREFLTFIAELRRSPCRGPVPWARTALSRQAATMSKLNETDIQGFVLRGYNLPVARYFFLEFESSAIQG